MFCTKCGAALSEDANFCNNCGAKAGCHTDAHTTEQAPSPTNSNSVTLKSSLMKLTSIIPLILVIIWAINYFGPKINTSWAIEKACAEVKSVVYESFRETPQVSGEIIYTNSPKYIVVVKYSFPQWNIEASHACLVHGYRENNCAILGMTKEMSVNYDYKGNIEDLKSLWALD